MRKLQALGGAAVLLAALLLGGCSQEATDATPEQAAPAATAESTAAPTPTLSVNPLTGLDDGNYANKRPVAVTLRTLYGAQPQWGVAAADVLVEGVTEGGTASLMALYADVDSISRVGPVGPGRDLLVRPLLSGGRRSTTPAPPGQGRQGRLEFILPQCQSQPHVPVPLRQRLGHILDEEGVVDIAAGDDEPHRVPGVLPAFQHGQDALRLLPIVKGRGGGRQKGGQLHFPQPPAAPDIHRPAHGQAPHPVLIGPGDGEPGGIDCKVDTLFTVVVPKQNGSGVHKMPPISPQRPAAGPPAVAPPPVPPVPMWFRAGLPGGFHQIPT